MITLFTTPKPFVGHIALIQRNAITSWTRLLPRPEIILIGNDTGTAEIATQLAVRHDPDILYSAGKAPFVNDVFAKGQQLASHDLVCYINADILLLQDFMSAVQRISLKQFLMVGRRWDLDVRDPIDFHSSEWQERMRREKECNASLHDQSGIDYFVFRRGLYTDIPPFAIGRTAWDNWLIYKARALRVPVVDATPVVTIIHQNHPPSYSGNRDDWEEVIENRGLVDPKHQLFTLKDATYLLTGDGLKAPRKTLQRFRRQLEIGAMLHPKYSQIYGWLLRLLNLVA